MKLKEEDFIYSFDIEVGAYPGKMGSLQQTKEHLKALFVSIQQMFFVTKVKRQLQMFFVTKVKRQLQMFFVTKVKRQLQKTSTTKVEK
ncbi:hypothetical protein ACQKNC_15445 [Lysinibacillus sp. NPDC094177]|uniref:hypothetical protein n=1 Tax=Lysinibacillus sp. NPDC094177 TaxID=3390580 RepID=UPI003CFEE85D